VQFSGPDFSFNVGGLSSIGMGFPQARLGAGPFQPAFRVIHLDTLTPRDGKSIANLKRWLAQWLPTARADQPPPADVMLTMRFSANDVQETVTFALTVIPTAWSEGFQPSQAGSQATQTFSDVSILPRSMNLTISLVPASGRMPATHFSLDVGAPTFGALAVSGGGTTLTLGSTGAVRVVGSDEDPVAVHGLLPTASKMPDLVQWLNAWCAGDGRAFDLEIANTTSTGRNQLLASYHDRRLSSITLFDASLWDPRQLLLVDTAIVGPKPDPSLDH
jgi:hypothetical protein